MFLLRSRFIVKLPYPSFGFQIEEARLTRTRTCTTC